MAKVIKENDETNNEEVVDQEDEESIKVNEVEVGTYKLHIAQLRKALEEYHVFNDINHALIGMAHPNVYHRIDLRNKEVLKKLETDMGLKIDYSFIESQIHRFPFLIRPNGVKETVEVKTHAPEKKITKKQMKTDAKRDKLQKKIDILKGKHKAIKNKKCDRAVKLAGQIEELETKRDRL